MTNSPTCRTCGASLQYPAGARTATCAFCQTVNTLSTPGSDSPGLVGSLVSPQDSDRILAGVRSFTAGEVNSQKLAAGLLGIFIGCLGIHKFVLGYQKAGIIMLLVSILAGVVTCGISTTAMAVIGLVEGIIYLTKTPEEFKATYIDARKEWF